MFVGEFSCLFVWAGLKLYKKLTKKTDEEGEGNDPDGVPMSPTTRAVQKANL